MKHIRKKTVEYHFSDENKVAKPSSFLELKSNILADITYKDVKGKNALKFSFYEPLVFYFLLF